MRQRFQQVQHDQTMTNSSNSSRHDWRDMFAVPPIIKQVFAQFPLSTYTANALPTRSPTHRDQHTLYTWTSTQDARTNNPSFNPTCLKWQTYLLFNLSAPNHPITTLRPRALYLSCCQRIRPYHSHLPNSNLGRLPRVRVKVPLGHNRRVKKCIHPSSTTQ
jgi:hypothetical protein